jgi:hypothetical protein
MWRGGSPGFGGICTATVDMDGGYITSADCQMSKPFVCSVSTLDKMPDNKCPKDHVAVKKECYRPGSERKTYVDATVLAYI